MSVKRNDLGYFMGLAYALIKIVQVAVERIVESYPDMRLAWNGRSDLIRNSNPAKSQAYRLWLDRKKKDWHIYR